MRNGESRWSQACFGSRPAALLSAGPETAASFCQAGQDLSHGDPVLQKLCSSNNSHRGCEPFSGDQ